MTKPCCLFSKQLASHCTVSPTFKSELPFSHYFVWQYQYLAPCRTQFGCLICILLLQPPSFFYGQTCKITLNGMHFILREQSPSSSLITLSTLQANISAGKDYALHTTGGLSTNVTCPDQPITMHPLMTLIRNHIILTEDSIAQFRY